MCEYCGCQSLASIDELTREHETLVNLVGRVRQAHQDGDITRMADLARQISAVLGPHTEVEEHGLFPALAPEFPEKIAALEAEHRRVDRVLAEADAGVPADPAWPARFLEALALLREHILKEQDGVFPAALACLSTEQWEAVEAVRARVTSRTAQSSAV
ncbi:hemerythrin domain-containing protein [Streptomyces thermoalcalitolerans]|uniref:Hemerythrin domain-containing protein n=1 Tax=Streptomyces thermoalcalitolerans TaxID=65605 RepID=A0ABN1PTI9_9ACTN